MTRGFNNPPESLHHAALDNLLIVTGKEFQFKQHWQDLANTLPQGTVLIILPQNGKERSTLEGVASTLRRKGQSVEIRESQYSIS